VFQEPKYQVGALNTDENMPAFVAFDIIACNGVIHIIDDVLLP
jgi:uncharacterized surface protein with fasciclin (FAS1) repeats